MEKIKAFISNTFGLFVLDICLVILAQYQHWYLDQYCICVSLIQRIIKCQWAPQFVVNSEHAAQHQTPHRVTLNPPASSPSHTQATQTTCRQPEYHLNFWLHDNQLTSPESTDIISLSNSSQQALASKRDVVVTVETAGAGNRIRMLDDISVLYQLTQSQVLMEVGGLDARHNAERTATR